MFFLLHNLCAIVHFYQFITKILHCLSMTNTIAVSRMQNSEMDKGYLEGNVHLLNLIGSQALP